MVENGELYTQIIEKLRFEPNIDESNITVSIKYGNIILLGGKVKSYTEKYLAEEALEKIENVKGIANELEVELALNYKINYADIVKSALDSLQSKLFVPHEKIKIAVEKGYLTLTGEVEYNYQKDQAEKAVEDLYGVIFVTNDIKVNPHINPYDVKDKIIKEFVRNAKIDATNIRVEVDGSKVNLKGEVKNFDEYREARNAAWSIPGVTKVTDQLKISW